MPLDCSDLCDDGVWNHSLSKCILAAYLSTGTSAQVVFDHKDQYGADEAASCPIGGQHAPELYLAKMARDHFVFGKRFLATAFWYPVEVADI
jgi:hypothetical protein